MKKLYLLIIVTVANFAFSLEKTDFIVEPGVPKPVMVFKGGEEGIPEFRIPTITTTRKGTLLAFAEGRYHKTDHGQNDIVMKRSTDGEKTWSKLVMIHGDKDFVFVNPSPVSLSNGIVFIAYEAFPFGYHARNGREDGITFKMMDDGYTSPRSQKMFIRMSKDDGKTWSKPRDITKYGRPATGIINSGSPSNGIQIKSGKYKGRILLPMFNTQPDEKGNRTWFNSVLISDDNGRNWRRSKYVPYPESGDPRCNENLICELPNGDIMINSRGKIKTRWKSISKDGGVTWSRFETVKELVGRPCNCGLLGYDYKGTKLSIFTQNNTGGGRFKGTSYISKDNGKTWTNKKLIDKGRFGYSQLTQMKDGRVGLIYEPFGTVREEWDILFTPIPIEFFTK